MCTNSLWPLLHSMLVHASFSTDDWSAYIQTNTEYARTTMQLIETHRRPPLVWIHDYHLMSMPMILRRMLDDSITRIAFCLHTPFPAWDLFRLNPWSCELVVGLLGAHTIVFLTPTYAANFLDCCCRILGAQVDRDEMMVEFEGRTTVVRVLPVGFDLDWFESMSQISGCEPQKEKIILGVDRLDYTKG